MDWLSQVFRKEILAMAAYSSAKTEGDSRGLIALDANESPYLPYNLSAEYNRYPDPQPRELMAILARIYGVNPNQLILGRGMDEIISIIIQATCRAYSDSMVIFPPTFGYYKIAGQIQGANIIELPLGEHFTPNFQAIPNDDSIKLIIVCSPNNPTGNGVDTAEILALCQKYKGRAIVAVDEAYIEFADSPSIIEHLQNNENLLVMRTLSKAYGLAGLRLGVGIAHPQIIQILLKILPPYPIAGAVIDTAKQALSPMGLWQAQVNISRLKNARNEMVEQLKKSPLVDIIFPTQTNFILFKTPDPDGLYQKFKQAGILVRNRNREIAGCLRVSVGDEAQNAMVLHVMGVGDGHPPTAPRSAQQTRTTKETDIVVEVIMDNKGTAQIHTGIGFYDHLLEQLARHSGISLVIQCKGDLHIDTHHTIEDVAITLGMALNKSLGDKRGIARFGFVLPMDETQTTISMDISGRGHLEYNCQFPDEMVGQMPTSMVQHFFHSLATNMGVTLHIASNGQNSHHLAESQFKCFAKVLKQAIMQIDNNLPSTKGVL